MSGMELTGRSVTCRVCAQVVDERADAHGAMPVNHNAPCGALCAGGGIGSAAPQGIHGLWWVTINGRRLGGVSHIPKGAAVERACDRCGPLEYAS